MLVKPFCESAKIEWQRQATIDLHHNEQTSFPKFFSLQPSIACLGIEAVNLRRVGQIALAMQTR